MFLLIFPQMVCIKTAVLQPGWRGDKYPINKLLHPVLSRDTNRHKGGLITRSNKSMVPPCGEAGVRIPKISFNTSRYNSSHTRVFLADTDLTLDLWVRAPDTGTFSSHMFQVGEGGLLQRIRKPCWMFGVLPPDTTCLCDMWEVSLCVHMCIHQAIQSAISLWTPLKKDRLYRVFSCDVTAAILVFQNKETAAILVNQTSHPGIELYFYANITFLVTWVKTL